MQSFRSQSGLLYWSTNPYKPRLLIVKLALSTLLIGYFDKRHSRICAQPFHLALLSWANGQTFEQHPNQTAEHRLLVGKQSEHLRLFRLRHTSERVRDQQSFERVRDAPLG